MGESVVKRRVWFGLSGAIAVTAAWWSWSRNQGVAPLPASPAPEAFVRFVGAGDTASDQILRERASLLDPTPLFYPTEWNYKTRSSLAEGRLAQTDQVFSSFDPKLTVPEQTLAPYQAEPAAVPEKLSDLLVQRNEAPFAGMGQVDLQSAMLPVRGGFVEVRALQSGEVILAQSITGIQPPRQDFPPVEFLIVVGNAGLVGAPILVAGSGWDEVDAFFRTYLVKTYHLGERLSPGRYRVVVGA